MIEKLKQYIEENLIMVEKTSMETMFKCTSIRDLSYDNECLCNDIDCYIDNNINKNLFQTLLFKYIDDRNLKDSDVYNKVHIDRRLFSKIRSNCEYHPSKDTVILLGLALELSENEILELLESAAYSLPKNNYYDLIIRFCFTEGIYKIKDVNELLASYNCKLFNY